MRSLIVVFLLCLAAPALAGQSHSAPDFPTTPPPATPSNPDSPDAPRTPDQNIDPNDPPHADSYGAAAPACASDGRNLTDPAAILQAIKGAQFCWQAVQLADSCSSGIASDANYVNAALPICEEELKAHKPTAKDKALLASMITSCDQKWKGKAGQQHESMDALCRLKATQWTSDLTSEN